MTAVSVVLAIAIWLAALHRVSQPGQSVTKPAFINDQPTDAHNLRCIGLTAMVATLYVPPVATAIDGWFERPGTAATAMFALMVVGTGELLMALRCVALEPSRARAGRVRRGAWLIGVVAAMTLALILGAPATSDVTLPWGSAEQLTWMAVYWGAWLSWCGTAGLRAGFIATRYARRVPSRITRISLRFLTLGTVALVTYAVTKAIVIGMVVAGIETPSVLTVLTKSSVVIMAVAAIGTSLWPVAARAVERRRFLSDIEILTPLWNQLRPISPGIALLDDSAPLTDLTYEQARMRRYRMCLEIADWWVLLAHRLPQSAWSEALAGVEARDDAERVAAAGWTAAGLSREGTWPDTHSPPPPAAADVHEMQRFIVGVARVQEADSDRVRDRIERRCMEVVP